MMDVLLKEGLQQLLNIVIGGVLTVASVYGTLFVAKITQKAKIEIAKLKDEQAKIILDASLERLDQLLKTNIVAMENTLKKELTKAIEDGVIEKEELKMLALNVKENVLNQLGRESLDVLNNGLNDLGGYIEARLEQLLVEVKNSNAK